jgi:epoxide hydrolase-like predicted phosphatase
VAERRGLLVDWGGVLTTNVFGSFAAFCERRGLETQAVAATFGADPRGRELLADFECGRLAAPDFERELAGLLGLGDHVGLIADLFGGMGADHAMVDAVRGFRAAGVRTGLLSNSWGTDTYDRTHFDALFDVLVISGEEGVRKPDPRIYELAIERIGLPATELVFVDDLPGNLKPARELGIATVVHRGAEQTIAELSELLGVSPLAGPTGPPAAG